MAGTVQKKTIDYNRDRLMITKLHPDWPVQLKGVLVGMASPDHGLQQLSPLSWHWIQCGQPALQ